MLPLVSKQIRKILPGFRFSASSAAKRAWGSCGVASPPKKQMQEVRLSTASARASGPTGSILGPSTR
jgi:hypothetical protein